METIASRSARARWAVPVVCAMLLGNAGSAVAGDLWSDGPREVKVAFVLLAFSDTQDEPTSPEEIRSALFTDAFSANAFLQAASSGLISITGDVFGWYRIPFGHDPSGDQLSAWLDAGAAAAQRDGHALDAYDVVFFGYAGTGSVSATDGRRVWMDLAYGPRWTTIAHEIGHHLGLAHATTLMCEDDDGVPVTMGGQCRHSSDPFDLMGATAWHHQFNAWNMLRLGILSPTEYPDGSVQTVTCEGVYELAPSEVVVRDRVQVLRIPRPSGDSLYLDLRQPRAPFDDFSPDDPIVNGVGIRIAPETTEWAEPYLLDLTPGSPSPSPFLDASLAVGRAFVDPGSETAITTLSVSSDAARVHIAPGWCPAARDADGDGLCDGCDICAATIAGPQEWRAARLDFRSIDDGIPGNDTLRFRGSLRPAIRDLDPARGGVRVEIRSDAMVARLDLLLPASGWSARGRRFVYRERAAGSRSMQVTARADGWFDVALDLSRATVGVVRRDAPLHVTFAFGAGSGAEPGACAEVTLAERAKQPSTTWRSEQAENP